MSFKFRILGTLALAVLLAGAVSAQTPPFTRTVIVNNTGVPSTDGAALLSAIAGLTPAPDYVNRWLVKLETGIYDVGSTPVVIPSYVNLVGSGIDQTIIQGSYGPPPGFLLGGLVQITSHSEARDLAISCFSEAGVLETCQAMSIDTGNPRLSNLRINVGGTGTGSHWGIRTFDAGPRLDDVEVSVDADTGYDTYGIVYGGNSTINIQRSSITARDGSSRNWALVIKENLGWSIANESSFTGIGGTDAAGIVYLQASTSQNLQLTDCKVQGYGGSSSNRGIGEESSFGGTPKIWVRGGLVLGSGGDGIVVNGATVYVVNSEIQAANYAVSANNVRIGSTWIRGGTVNGVSELCAGVFTNSFTFFPNTCP